MTLGLGPERSWLKVQVGIRFFRLLGVREFLCALTVERRFCFVGNSKGTLALAHQEYHSRKRPWCIPATPADGSSPLCDSQQRNGLQCRFSYIDQGQPSAMVIDDLWMGVEDCFLEFFQGVIIQVKAPFECPIRNPP